MNAKHALTALPVMALMAACTKDEVPGVEFDAAAVATTVKVTDSVVFTLGGNAEVIGFYSGEAGNNYENRNRTARTDGTLRFSFQSRVDNMTGFDLIGAGALKVMASTDFKATYSGSTNPAAAASADSAMVNSATWTDISNRFFLPSTGTPSTFYPSNEAELNDLVKDPAKPLFLAFKFSSPQTPTTLGANGITIGSLVLYNQFADNSIVNYTIAPGGSATTIWRSVKAANTAGSWAFSTTQLKYTSAVTTSFAEQWAISQAYYPNRAVPDKAIVVKGLTMNKLTRFAYKFSTPGTYTVVFIASNNRKFGTSETMKELTITVTP